MRNGASPAVSSVEILFSLGVLLLTVLAGCYAIPPELPEDYIGSETALGWPPPQAYTADAFHPANRWFHRVFSGRTPHGRVAPVDPATPFPKVDHLAPVDRAEVAALLEALTREPLPDDTPELTRAIFRRDLSEASAAFAKVDADLGERHRRFAREAEKETPSRLDESTPKTAQQKTRTTLSDFAGLFDKRSAPPFSPHEWQSTGEGHAPAGAWHKWRSKGDPPRALLVIESAYENTPSEYWLLRERRGELVPVIYRFDRDAWTRGEAPWVSYRGGDEVTIRLPFGAEPETRRGTVRELCRPCHEKELEQR